MENRNRRRRKRSTELPDTIIQHIQSFLEPHEAAETMLISKSWRRAWSTRPFLYFDFNNLWYRSYDDNVSINIVDRTLKSYVERGLTVMKFHLDIGLIQERWLKLLRQTNVIDLHLRPGSNWTSSMFQEIFLTKSLQVLSLTSSSSQLVLNLTHLDIQCLNLRKLEFRDMKIDPVTFWHIMSSCPLIEELLLTKCSLIDFASYNIGSQSIMFTGECRCLKMLSLVETEINDEQLQDILSKSPHLEDFNLIDCSNLVKPINLSSVALKRVSLVDNVQAVRVDAPNLHKLMLSSRRLRPFPITITRPITKGMVKITIIYSYGDIDESWLHGLKELAMFAKLNVKFTSCYGYPLTACIRILRSTPHPPRYEVEALRFKRLENLPILYSMFSVCHPKIVLLYRLDTISKRKHLIELLKDTSYRGNLEYCNLNDQNKCWRHYIKDAKLYYGIDNEKKPLEMNGLETGLGNNEMITLALEWESSY